MSKSSESKEYVFNPDRSSHFDLCQYCRNCNDCINKHWKTCRLWLDVKALKEQRPICYR